MLTNKLRIPPQPNLKIEKFSGGVVTVADTLAKNAVFDTYSDGKLFAMQRPSFNIRDDASVETADENGRGIYYWQRLGETYFVNNDTVYKGGYSLSLAATITGGKDRVYFAELGLYLVIIDSENNQGWYIHTTTPTVITEITDVDFPPKQTPSFQLSRGAAVLNGTLYVLDDTGTVSSCAVEDPTSWTATDFIEAEFENDGGSYIGLHHNNIVVFGGKTCQFFYDAANPVGSPLSPRTDLSYRIGGLAMDVYAEAQDNIYFVGTTDGGHVGVYTIQSFNIVAIGSTDMNALLSSAIYNENMTLVVAAFSMGDSIYFSITTAFDANPKDVQQTFMYSSRFNSWGIWCLAHVGYKAFDVISWSGGKEVATSSGQGITARGDIITISDDFFPQDTLLAQIYVVDDYVEIGYVSETEQSGMAIPFELIFGYSDLSIRENKRYHTLQVVAEGVESGNVNISWSDRNNNNYGGIRVLQAENLDDQTNRLGSARRRNFKLTHSLEDQYRIVGLEVEVSRTGV